MSDSDKSGDTWDPDKALKLPLFVKLALCIATIALVPYVLSSYQTRLRSEKTLRSEIQSRLTAVAVSKGERMENYVGEQRRIVSILAQSLDVLTAFRHFGAEGAPNVSPEVSGDAPANAPGSPRSADVRAQILTPLRRYVDRDEYTNLFLIDASGNIVVSVEPHPCTDTNLDVGPCQSTQLAAVYDRAKTLLETEISSFTPDKAHARPAAFIAAPALDRGTLLGVVALELSTEPIYDIVNEYSGLGTTGELLVGMADGERVIFVSPTRHDPQAAFQRTIPLDQVTMAPLQDAVRGIQRYARMVDYRGVESVAVSRYLPSIRWGMVVKQDADEAFAVIAQERQMAWAASAATVLLVLVTTFLVARSISRPISQLTQVVQRIAQGDLEQEIQPTTRDEIAVLGHWFNEMTAQLRKTYATIEDKVRVRTRELESANAELREARDAAEAASRAKSAFLANMSHELRTPLNAVLGYTELLLEDAEADEDAQRTADLTRIRQAGRHLLDLISDILDLSKIEAGKLELFVEEVDVHDLMNGVITTVKPRIDANGNSLQIEFGSELGHAYLDVRKTKQILINLLDNAAKFTQKGTVSFKVHRFRRDGRDMLGFTVRDTGIGIPAHKFAQLFQNFEQLDSSTTRRYGGTGLGLALSQKLTMLMGGRIEVQSEVGSGSTFLVELPAKVQPARDSNTGMLPEEAESAGPEERLGAAQVVVIDDAPDGRELFRRTLEQEGYTVLCADNAERGLSMIRENLPDVVLLDVMMPGMDGWATLAVMKSDARLSSIPVVMVSIVDDKRRGFVLGASDYLIKPVDRPRLLDAIRPFVEGTNDKRPILVVEDDEATRHATSRILQAEGWQVRVATNGHEGLKEVEEEEPALVLLDLMMPDLDGFGFLEELRKQPKYEHVPVIVLTAKEVTPNEAQRLRDGLARTFRKGSVSRETLVSEIRMRIAKQKHTKSKGPGPDVALH